MNMIRVSLTPESAKEMGRTSIGQRPIQPAHVHMLRREMINGRWVASPAVPIIIGRGGAVVNGQHRLAAIAGCPAGTVVDVYILRDESIETAVDVPVDLNVLPRKATFGTSIREHCAAEARALIALATGRQKVSAGELRDAAVRISSLSDRLSRSSKSAVSVVGVRAGALCAMVAGDADYVREQYAALVYHSYEQMTPHVAALTRIIVDGKGVFSQNGVRHSGQQAMIVVSAEAFRRSHRESRVIRYAWDDMFSWAKERARELVGGQRNDSP